MMPTISSVPGSTVTGQWPVVIPTQTEADHYQNEDNGVSTPDDTSYNQSLNSGEYEEDGGFDFSAIPIGASITRVRVIQRTRSLGDPVGPGLAIALRSGGITKDEANWAVVTGGDIQNLGFDFDSPNITRDELVTGFTLRRTAIGGITTPTPEVLV